MRLLLTVRLAKSGCLGCPGVAILCCDTAVGLGWASRAPGSAWGFVYTALCQTWSVEKHGVLVVELKVMLGKGVALKHLGNR